MRGALLLAVLVLLVGLVNTLAGQSPVGAAEAAVFCLGFVLLAGVIAGRYAGRAALPMLTGYLLAGFAFGPHVLGALRPEFSTFSAQALNSLTLFDSLALGLIAFTAGGELRLSELRRRLGTIGRVAASQLGIIFLGMTALLLPFVGFLDVAAGMGWPALLGMAMLLGVVCTSNSPAAAVAVISELNAHGPLTTITLGVTVLKDVLVMVLFSIVLILARLLLGQGDPGGGGLAGLLALWEVVGSLGLGLLLGWLLTALFERLESGLSLLLLALGFLNIELGRELHLSGVLLNIAAGFYVQNYSRHGPKMIEALESYSMPVLIVFFAVAGARIDLPALERMWPMALLLIGGRLFFLWLGTRLALPAAERRSEPSSHLWLAFVSQAGLDLGIAAMIGRSFPVVGPELRTLLVAAIAVNLLVGPIALRRVLVRAGEVRAVES